MSGRPAGSVNSSRPFRRRGGGGATNGQGRIDLIETQKPDLALLDLNMPEAGGPTSRW
jgi:DNA-binding NarL/FixJ family response regulator